MAKRVIFPHAPAYGGPGSFQRAFEEQLSRLGINTEYYPQNAAKNDTVLIVNGTKKIFWLLKQKYFYRSKIILRLDGKVNLQITDARLPIHIIRIILIKICKLIAHGVIYQSHFSMTEWKPKLNEKNIVIHNGHRSVALQTHLESSENCFVIVAEGVIQGKIAERILPILMNRSNVMIFGHISKQLSPTLQKAILNSKHYRGVVPKDELLSTFIKKKCIYISLEYKANCPNVVIEAMSFGVPVLGFRTGSMEELVPHPKSLLDLRTLGDENLPTIMQKMLADIEQRYADLSLSNLSHQREHLSVENMTERYLKFFQCR